MKEKRNSATFIGPLLTGKIKNEKQNIGGKKHKHKSKIVVCRINILVSDLKAKAKSPLFVPFPQPGHRQ